MSKYKDFRANLIKSAEFTELHTEYMSMQKCLKRGWFFVDEDQSARTFDEPDTGNGKDIVDDVKKWEDVFTMYNRFATREVHAARHAIIGPKICRIDPYSFPVEIPLDLYIELYGRERLRELPIWDSYTDYLYDETLRDLEKGVKYDLEQCVNEYKTKELCQSQK